MSQKKVPWPTDYFGQLAKKLHEMVWHYLGDISWLMFGWNQPQIWQSISWNDSLVQILTSDFEQKNLKKGKLFYGTPGKFIDMREGEGLEAAGDITK